MFADGSHYEGEFENNDIHGHGFYTWPDQRTYEGQWMKNKMHGKGLSKWKDGKIYEGNFFYFEII